MPGCEISITMVDKLASGYKNDLLFMFALFSHGLISKGKAVSSSPNFAERPSQHGDLFAIEEPLSFALHIAQCTRKTL